MGRIHTSFTDLVHVNANGSARTADFLASCKDVEASTGSKIDDNLALSSA